MRRLFIIAKNNYDKLNAYSIAMKISQSVQLLNRTLNLKLTANFLRVKEFWAVKKRLTKGKWVTIGVSKTCHKGIVYCMQILMQISDKIIQDLGSPYWIWRKEMPSDEEVVYIIMSSAPDKCTVPKLSCISKSNS